MLGLRGGGARHLQRLTGTTVALLAVDPHRLHVYWELADPSVPGRAALRFYDATDSALDGATAAHGYFEIEVDLAARNWYIDVSEPSAVCYAELGLRRRNGEWVELGRSNTLVMPRPFAAHPAAVVEIPGTARLVARDTVSEGEAGPVEACLTESSMPRER